MVTVDQTNWKEIFIDSWMLRTHSHLKKKTPIEKKNTPVKGNNCFFIFAEYIQLTH